MATTTRTKDVAPAAAATDADMIGVLLRMVSRLAVKGTQAPGKGGASFRQIAVQELGIARHQDLDVVDAWLAAHPDA